MLNPNHPAVIKALAATGLELEALLEKATLIGLKELAKPKPKVARVKAKANPDGSRSKAPRTRLKAGDVLPNGEVIEFVENGVGYVMRPEFKRKLLEAKNRPIDKSQLRTVEEVREMFGLPRKSA